jgi:hypothetical protein
MKKPCKILLSVLLLDLLSLPTGADEGMWPFNHLPRQTLAAQYGWAPTEAWLEHVQRSSVRVGNSGSGSFVSPDGLVLTNHHVASDCIQELGSAEQDYMSQGFYALMRSKELRCPSLELNVLLGIEDVTAAVNAGVTPTMEAAARHGAQQQAMARLEKQCAERSGLRCQVVVLYEGGLFNLYRFKKYNDVRLVFAPEADIAFFGGDPDNFTYPRYDLDMAFLRVYENGRPARVTHYLKWNPKLREGELVFVSGNPGSTGRLLTLAQLEFLRDIHYPARLKLLQQRLNVLRSYSDQGREEARIARDQIFSYENSYKAITGYLAGLEDTDLMGQKAAQEKQLREEIAADHLRQKEFGSLWDALAQAQRDYSSFYEAYQLLDQASPPVTDFGLEQVRLFEMARLLVRMPVETAKPNEERLPEYRDSNLDALKENLLSPAPIYDSFQKLMLARLLREMAEALRGDDPLVQEIILTGRSPEQAARDLVEGSQLGDLEVRRKLLEGGAASLEAFQDPMLDLARLIDPQARGLRRRYETQVQAVERKNGSLLAEALFLIRGTSIYPEATFTPRLSYGVVKGYVEEGRPIRWYTSFHGLYERATDAAPYRLPQRWVEAKPGLVLDTPFNFVSTNDIIGGNSGSPVVNQNGELVGLIFDGNIHQLPNRFLYRDAKERSVAVHVAGILEALRKVYGARALLEELEVVPEPR